MEKNEDDVDTRFSPDKIFSSADIFLENKQFLFLVFSRSG